MVSSFPRVGLGVLCPWGSLWWELPSSLRISGDSIWGETAVRRDTASRMNTYYSSANGYGEFTINGHANREVQAESAHYDAKSA